MAENNMSWLCNCCNTQQHDQSMCVNCGTPPNVGVRKCCVNCASSINARDVYCIHCSQVQETPDFTRESLTRAATLKINMSNAKDAIAARISRRSGVVIGCRILLTPTELLECLSVVKASEFSRTGQFQRAASIVCGFLNFGDPYLPGQYDKGRKAAKSICNWWSEYTGERAETIRQSRSQA
eukprot:GDKJ01015695.1.p1 GENE.GDKJ01015695.1~~GDKJ01015695.1.p1  ORF type:complete len:182 (+),score=4.81 GDKJ01015695.1:37-582(+)